MDNMCTHHFSHDLFHSHIIPDLLSNYIHNLLLYPHPPRWNPFLTLPLVSRDFYVSCRILCISIFGTMSDPQYEGMTPCEIMAELLEFAQDSWRQANLPPLRAGPVDYFPQQELKCTESLLQVYVCAATAKSYLNLDVLWHLELEKCRLAGELDDAQPDDEDMDTMMHEDVEMDADEVPFETPPVPARRFKMRDDNMHRTFLPLTCAIELCDKIRPARLAHIVADYIAEIIPLYSTAPLILKYTQDLEMYVTGEHRHTPIDTTVFLKQTLGLVDGTSFLLQNMQEDTGKLVRSFKRPSFIPMKVLNDTNILQALDKVAAAYWGEGTGWINNYTMAIRDRLIAATA